MSVGDITWKVNGIDLDTALGAVLTDATVVRADVTTRRTEVEIPGEHGVLSPGLPVYTAPQVLLSPKWHVTSQAQLEEKVNHARALLGQPTLTLTRVSGGLETAAAARLVSISAGDFLVGTYESILATLTVPGVFFRAAEATTPDQAFDTDLTNWEVAALSGSTGPVGDATIRITGPATSVTLTDPMSGTGLSWAGSLTAGQYLFLTGRPLTARKSTSPDAWAAGGSSELANVSFPAAGRLQLFPVVQSPTSRKVLLSAAGGGRTVGVTKIAVRGKPSYL